MFITLSFHIYNTPSVTFINLIILFILLLHVMLNSFLYNLNYILPIMALVAFFYKVFYTAASKGK